MSSEENIGTNPECECPVPIKAMSDWILGSPDSDPEECRPCALPPVAQWYESELRENAAGDLANDLAGVIETGDPHALCAKLDEIKEKVPPSLKKRLLEFDCHIQVQDLSALRESEESLPVEGD